MLAAVPNTEWTSTSVARVYSDPFGGIRGNTDADVPGDHRFLGATRDADSGLTLLGARYYDPVTGCFISVDPILNLEVPAHLHAYAYGFNNPVTFSDASGLEPKDQNGNFDGDPYSSPSTTSWAYLNGCGGNLSCVGTWVGNFQLNFYGGLAEGVGGLLLFACSSLCMVPMSVNSAVTAFSDWDAHLANEQAKGEQFREWWSDPWNNFWRPIGDNPGHAWGLTVFTANTLAVPGGGLVKLGGLGTKAGTVGAETFFRTMSADDFLRLNQTGAVQATGETFITESAEYALRYGGVTVQFSVVPGTKAALEAIGVRNRGGGEAALQYPDMPVASSGWGQTSALFKGEGDNVNIGLGAGRALEIFNDAILSWTKRQG
ncbi:MAG: hypothetical protein RLZZ608_1284 [Actinomycetota bacterium]